ncbi:MAG: hypothetical protein HY741_25290 [Chloroflexi bacterium]|nr:hypothetical protein [Chloroflexota bacterium]
MTREERVIAKLGRLPEQERAQLYRRIEQWVEAALAAQHSDIQRALSAVARTWATIRLNPETLRWIAESKDLEYEID